MPLPARGDRRRPPLRPPSLTTTPFADDGGEIERTTSSTADSYLARTWTTPYSTTTGAGGTQTLNTSGPGPYIRVYGTVRSTRYGYSLWEFRVFGT